MFEQRALEMIPDIRNTWQALCDQTCRCQYKFDVKSKRAAIK